MIDIKPFNPKLVPAGAALKQAAAVEFVKPGAQMRQEVFLTMMNCLFFSPSTWRKKRIGAFGFKGRPPKMWNFRGQPVTVCLIHVTLLEFHSRKEFHPKVL